MPRAPRTARLVFAALPALALLGGCSQKCQRPALYAPDFDLAIIAQPLHVAPDAYFLLDDQPTVGRFPVSLALARHVVAPDPNAADAPLAAQRPINEAKWTETFRGLAGVRDVMFLSPVAMRAYDDTPDQRCSVARKLGAGLLLDYAFGQTGPNSAKLVGVLYQTRDARPIATIHAQRIIRDEDGDEVEPKQVWQAADDDHGCEPDIRDYDAAFQASRAFERHALNCIRELLERDQPAPTTQPHRWSRPPQ